MKYEDLKILEELRSKGSITEEEFQREKNKILNEPSTSQNNLWGFRENTYIMLMHLSQLLGLFTIIGFIVPIIMWLAGSGENGNENVNEHGKNIANFMISIFIYGVVAGLLSFVLIGIPILIVLVILEIIFVILASIKANNGEYWRYPLSITFIK